jgi:hypothetical protein
LGSCFLSAADPLEPPRPDSTYLGRVLFCWTRTLLLDGPAFLLNEWAWSPDQCNLFNSYLLSIVSPSQLEFPPAPIPTIDPLWFKWDAPPRPYPTSFCVLFHSIRSGLPWDSAINMISQMRLGHVSADGRAFANALFHSLPPPDRVVSLSSSDEPVVLSLLFSGPVLAAVLSSHSILPRLPPSPSTRLVCSPRSGGYSFSSRFLPEFIRLKKIPKRDIMSVFHAAPEWHRRLGPLDAVTAHIAEGRLVMPKPRFPLHP